MRILVINPNTTTAMTQHVVNHLSLHLDAAAHISPLTAAQGAPVIATQEAFDDAAQTACTMLSQAVDEGLVFDKVLLACFGDPGLEAMRLKIKQPVIGLAHASLKVAQSLGKPFAVVTAGAAWQSILVQRFTHWGASPLFAGVQVIGGSGLDVFNHPVAALAAVQVAIKTARASGAENIILGGAVFAGYKAVMQASGIDTQGVLDCAACAADALNH